jgi:gamma-glutamyl:cysteine ligase YbdK (ATP-grasp superfamily)
MQSPIGSGQYHETAEVPLPDAVARACHDINGALAAVISCFEYIADTTQGRSRDAADDGREAARRIAALTRALNNHCHPARLSEDQAPPPPNR